MALGEPVFVGCTCPEPHAPVGVLLDVGLAVVHGGGDRYQFGGTGVTAQDAVADAKVHAEEFLAGDVTFWIGDWHAA